MDSRNLKYCTAEPPASTSISSRLRIAWTQRSDETTTSFSNSFAQYGRNTYAIELEFPSNTGELLVLSHGAKTYVLESGLEFQHSAKQVRDAKIRAGIGGMTSSVRELARVARKVVKEETTFRVKQGAPLYELTGYKSFLGLLANAALG